MGAKQIPCLNHQGRSLTVMNMISVGREETELFVPVGSDTPATRFVERFEKTTAMLSVNTTTLKKVAGLSFSKAWTVLIPNKLSVRRRDKYLKHKDILEFQRGSAKIIVSFRDFLSALKDQNIITQVEMDQALAPAKKKKK